MRNWTESYCEGYNGCNVITEVRKGKERKVSEKEDETKHINQE